MAGCQRSTCAGGRPQPASSPLGLGRCVAAVLSHRLQGRAARAAHERPGASCSCRSSLCSCGTLPGQVPRACQAAVRLQEVQARRIDCLKHALGADLRPTPCAAAAPAWGRSWAHPQSRWPPWASPSAQRQTDCAWDELDSSALGCSASAALAWASSGFTMASDVDSGSSSGEATAAGGSFSACACTSATGLGALGMPAVLLAASASHMET